MNVPEHKLPAWKWMTAIAVIGACVLLFFFEPSHYSFYPQCWLHAWTGYSCPGCGGLRATHQLLHGNVLAAFKLNPLFVLLLPAFAWMFIREIGKHVFKPTLPSPFNNRRFGWTVTIAVFVFGVARNLPLPVVAWMSS
jgi:hypothetical protein